MLTELRPEMPEGCVSNLVLDEWKAGELDDERSAEVARHAAGCPRCAQRLRDMDAAEAAFREAAPAFLQAPRATKPARQADAGGKRRRFAAVAGAGAAALAIAAGAALFLHQPSDGGGVRSKGGSAHIGFFVKRGGRVFEGGSDERLHPGDQVRFVATTDRSRFLAILSLDGAGVASVYHPSAGSSAPIGPARDVALEGGIELDEALGEEKIFAVFCDDPIDLPKARAELATTRTVTPPSNCSVDTLRWTKEP